MEELYVKMQKMWVDELNLKDGDTVKIVSFPEDKQCGWEHNQGCLKRVFSIGDTFKIIITENSIDDAHFGYSFPFFCLEFVEHAKEENVEIDGVSYDKDAVLKAIELIEACK